MSKLRFLLIPLLVVVAAGLGLWLHAADRTAGDTWHAAGTEAPDRIDVFASVQRIDAAGREAVLRVLAVPLGRFGEDDGAAPAADLHLLNSSSLRGDHVYPAHQRISSTDLPIALSGGTVTDYPFDSYDVKIQFAAEVDGESVPVLFTLDKVDSLFGLSVRSYQVANGVGGAEVRFSRSAGVLVFAVFMMITMWGLAIAVLLGAKHLVTRRRGLIWPAFGFMAATLFALAGFRNIAPGAPPIGSLLDYTAFYWAEAVIAVSVVVAVVAGAITERASAGPR
ncbi:protein of unknown function [Amycolatopsis xylanica]|uniref:DUF4436 domain-containing protein n=1 Tax=Amycolatopsis xylanica TaxID=589385 RepID=A0A1H3GRH2_9PSEU|nr:DUF4436 family protein [Amycolatopsis xylanica]SDY05660.1 protein of unknown function [Amycolatopsis xylanica]